MNIRTLKGMDKHLISGGFVMNKDNLSNITKENLIKVSYSGAGKPGKPFITETNNKVK